MTTQRQLVGYLQYTIVEAHEFFAFRIMQSYRRQRICQLYRRRV